jgi:hypothetical protein
MLTIADTSNLSPEYLLVEFCFSFKIYCWSFDNYNDAKHVVEISGLALETPKLDVSTGGAGINLCSVFCLSEGSVEMTFCIWKVKVPPVSGTPC